MEKKKTFEDLKRMYAEPNHESDPAKAFKVSQRKKEYSELCDLLFGGFIVGEHPEWVKYGEHTMLCDVEERQRNTLRMLNGMRRILMGREKNFRPFVTGEDGKLSNEKIAAFTKELISFHPEADALSEDRKKLLERFFYCVITGPSVIHSRVRQQVLKTEYVIPETFSEFIAAAKDPVLTYRNRLKAAREEERNRLYPEHAGGFSFLMNQMYETLSNQSSRGFYTEEELYEAADEYAFVYGIDTDDVVRAWKNKKWKKNAVTEYSDDYDSENSFPEESWEYECCLCAWEKYYAGLPKENLFVPYYEELRMLLHQVEPFDLLQLTEEMIDRFLVVNKLSPLWSDDGYAIISELMEKFTEVMEEKLK